MTHILWCGLRGGDQDEDTQQTAARQALSRLDRLLSDGGNVTITRRGKPIAPRGKG